MKKLVFDLVKKKINYVWCLFIFLMAHLRVLIKTSKTLRQALHKYILEMGSHNNLSQLAECPLFLLKNHSTLI